VGLSVLALLLGVLAVAPQARSAGSAGTPAAGQEDGERIVTLTRPDRTPARARPFWTAERVRGAQPLPPMTTRRPGVQPRMAGGRAGSLAGQDLPARATALTVAGTAGPATVTRATNKVAVKVPKPYRNLPDRTNGKLLFRVGGSAYACSATAVNSPNKSLVWTAGHCVSDGAGHFHNSWIFVPAYSSGANGSTPYGKWRWSRVATTGQWHNRGNLSFDVAALVVEPRNGRRLVRRVGGQGIAFNRSAAGSYSAFGYPAAYPFNGYLQWRCNSRLKGRDTRMSRPYPMRITCDMTGGSSGGGWLRGIRNGVGTLLSVVSYGPPWPSSQTYGPYHGPAAKKLYTSMRDVRP
jgi:V8-like Glu-specific endopeptidase